MNQEAIILELEGLISSLGLSIRYEKGDFRGGDCVLYDQNLVVMNKKTTPAQKIAMLARVVGTYGDEDLYMKPVIRQVVDEEMSRYQSHLSSLQIEGNPDEDTDTERTES